MGETPALRPSDRQLLGALGQHGELGRSQLAALSGLPRTTIADAVARLQRHGLVVEREAPAAERPRTGRPPRLVALAPPAGLIAVIALTHVSLQAGVLGFDGTLYGRQSIDVPSQDRLQETAQRGLALLDQALHEASASRADLTCAVVGMPMPVDPAHNLVARPASPARDSGEQSAPEDRMPEHASLQSPWVPADLPAEIGRRLGVPAWAENDANLGALGEGAFGAAVSMPSFIYVKIVQGVGAGLVLDRRLHRGAGGLAGELAHIHIEDDGALCRCGGRGCLMTTLNAIRLVDRIQAVHPDAMTVADVLTLAARGDAGVRRLLRDLGRTIGRSLADFCVYVSPDGIVLDGILQKASGPVIDGIRETLYEFASPAVVSRVRVVSGVLADRAELLGATALARGWQFGQDILRRPGPVAMPVP